LGAMPMATGEKQLTALNMLMTHLTLISAVLQ
jgi:hypothetical protein